ncbi:MAG: PD40 domain-containing protein, partial [Acidobacteria bacterium]|nr:PD40 domain-containing protein [Acidobacteriota bacterium]
MNGKTKRLYEFDSYSLNPDERIFTKNGVPIQLAPRAFDVLVVLVQNNGSLVEKQDLIHQVWNDSFVEEANIQVQISAIRKALNDKNNGKYIETVPKRGYRFTSDVKTVEVGELTETPTLSLESFEQTASEKAKFTKPAPKKSKTFAAVLVAVIIVAAIGLLTYAFVKQKPRSLDFAIFSQRIKLKKLTDSGAAFGAAISPDGKYAAYQITNAGKYSLWLMELAANSSVQIKPPGETAFGGITFSPADDYIYYSTADSQPNSISSVYRMSRLGGEAKKLLTGTDSPIGFSADGKRFAFVRNNRELGETALLTADADGANEQTVAVRKKPDSFSTGKRPAFSPDGKTVACIGINAGENFLRVFVVNVADGAVKPLTSENWSALQDVIFLPDSDTLLLTAQDDRNFGPLQIWTTSLSGNGTAQKVTQELNNYVGLSLAADSGSLITTQSDAFNNIWILPNGDSNQARQTVSNKGGGRVDMSWTQDNRIVYTSNASGNPNIFIMNADGSSQTQLTADTFVKRSPIVSPDDRHIVFVSNQAGTEQIWLMDIDGQNQRQLTTAQIYRYPQFSPDGKWIIYSTWQDKKAYLWKVSIDGGEPAMLK